MLFTSTVFAAASGSIAGCTYSHNRYGQYVRNRSIPVNPNTVQQQFARTSFANLAGNWNLLLTQAQRDGWDAYAAAVPRVNSVGQVIFVTGLNWYIALNTLRLLATLAALDDAPTDLNMAILSSIDFTVTAPSTASIIFTNTDDWAGAIGGFLLASFSRGMNATRLFFKGPFRAADITLGAVVPPTSPQAATLPFVVTAGQRVYARFIACTADGRISLPQIKTTLAA